MDLHPTAEQQQLIDSFAALYAKESPIERVRRAEPGGFDPQLWRHLCDTGAVAMAVAEASGGGGATLLDLAFVAEQHGRHLGSAPLVEAQVAARLLSRSPSPAAAEALRTAIESTTLVTLSLRAPTNGTATLVPAGAVARAVVVPDGDRLCLVGVDGNRRAVANLGCLPVADVDTSGRGEPILAGPNARNTWNTAVDEWTVLTASALVGLGARALELGVDYAKERAAFGVKIATFQGVAHRLADCATALDGARLLVYEAAWAQTHDPSRFSELSAMSLAFASETARTITYWSLHFHGGYGVMMEYDLQLHFRRARAWPAVLAEPSTLYGWVADRRRRTAGRG